MPNPAGDSAIDGLRAFDPTGFDPPGARRLSGNEPVGRACDAASKREHGGFQHPRPIQTADLQPRVRAAYQQDPEVKAIISADGRVQHAQVITVIDVLRREKITKFAINTSPIVAAPAK